jgi:hypothetical protein
MEDRQLQVAELAINHCGATFQMALQFGQWWITKHPLTPVVHPMQISESFRQWLYIQTNPRLVN